MSKVLVCVAWPYANGVIHLGHMAGSILPPDIFSRYNRLLGNEVMMVGGSDQHGTPITVSAEKEGVSPEVIADRYHEINKKAIEDMEIEYSLFTKTHCDNHIEVVQDVFLKLLENGYLTTHESNQYYCPQCSKFLPDRYVEGICPECGAQKVRGDQCDACGKTFETGDLKDAYCVHCHSAPEIRPTEHYFLKLGDLNDRLLDYLAGKEWWRPNVRSFTTNWLKDGLHDRAITRDMEWGVPIPMEGWDSKVIYVWFDAVIGYLSASKEYSQIIGKPDYWKEFWMDPEVRHYYFLGKDNIPFHSIIWPSILMAYGGLTLPYDIPANEYLMYKGGKFSKSRGGAIDMPTVLSKYDPDIIRFYLSMVMPDTHDSEFSWEDFQTKVNTELVGNLGNYYHRCLSFTRKNFGSVPQSEGVSAEISKAIADAFSEYRSCMDGCDFKKAIKVVMELSHFGNRYFDSMKPWALVKTDKDACGKVLYDNLAVVKALAIMAWPFMPKASERIFSFMGLSDLEGCGYAAIDVAPVSGTELVDPVPVFSKVEVPKEILDAEKGILDGKAEEPKKKEKKEMVTVSDGPFKDFRKLDIRVAQITSIEDHPDAEKLYLMKVDVGEERQIVAGLKAYYSKEEMLGRKVLCLYNLKPAKLRGQRSEGMLLAADDEDIGGSTVLLLKPSADVPNGTKMNCGMDSSESRIEYKDFTNAILKVGSFKDGKVNVGDVLDVDGDSLPERIAVVVEDGKAVPVSDGNGCYATVDREITDGANVR